MNNKPINEGILTPEEKEYHKLAEEILRPHINERPYIKALLNANIKKKHHRTIYLRSIWEQRTEGPMNSGSSFEPGFTYEDFLRALTTVDYKDITEELKGTEHEEANKRVYMLDIPGKRGVIFAKELQDDDAIYAVDGHGSGSLEFGCENIPKPTCDKTTMIVATDQNGDDEFVLTMFPGFKTGASNLQRFGVQEGKRFTKKEVIDLMGENAVIKFISEDCAEKYRQAFTDKRMAENDNNR